MNTLNESYLLLSLVDRETIRQEVNNPEMTVLDRPCVNERFAPTQESGAD